MLSYFCNYVYGIFFSNSLSGQKRKHDDSSDYPPVKLRKLEDRGTFNVNSMSYEYISNMNRLENCFKENTESCSVNKDGSKKWANPSIMARQSIHWSGYSLRSSNTLDKRKSELRSDSQEPKASIRSSNDLCDVEVIKYVNKNSNHNSGKLVQKNKMSNRIFGTYQSTSRQNDKVRPPVQNSIKKSLNYLQQSYRLSEKIQYMQLLQHATTLNSSLSPFTIQNINKKGSKPSVPVIDLTNERNVIINRSRENIPWTCKNKSNGECKGYIDLDCYNKDVLEVNSLQNILKTHPVTEKSIIEEILSHHSSETAEKQRQVQVEAAKLKILSATNRKAYNDALEEKLRQYMRITTPALEEFEPEKEEYTLPDLSKEQNSTINSALIPSPAGEVLVEKFGLQIKRRDIQTLKGLNWLNDEVINFYMNLIMERGKESNMPKVYAFNTFFYPKLISSGHSSLKRWTKKVDIFSHDMILVPVHLGMHWCMAVIDFRSKVVRYYDSMGSSNNRCLEALLSYLEAESLDKKGKTFSTNDWERENVEEIPQQMNGSDCGVFSCMFAEHLARDSPLIFSQDHMPYFRRKMVLEIIEAKLLT